MTMAQLPEHPDADRIRTWMQERGVSKRIITQSLGAIRDNGHDIAELTVSQLLRIPRIGQQSAELLYLFYHPDEEQERFITPGELPNAYEQEVLTILAEECNEVAIRVSKLKRFGRDEVQPGQASALTNSVRLAHELGDVYALVHLCLEAKLIRADDILDGRLAKDRKLAVYMQQRKLRE
jgi:hypothetical protein